jgi:hypothetical protein
VKDSNKQKLRVICKDQSCSWYLYATPTGCYDAWAIKKISYKHICRATIIRVDHAQLTAKVIADIIREDVEKDRWMIETKMQVLSHPNCTPVDDRNLTRISSTSPEHYLRRNQKNIIDPNKSNK